jgi:hypothetical protein
MNMTREVASALWWWRFLQQFKGALSEEAQAAADRYLALLARAEYAEAQAQRRPGGPGRPGGSDE